MVCSVLLRMLVLKFFSNDICLYAYILYAACPCLYQLISAQFALEMCLAVQNRSQKTHEKERENVYLSQTHSHSYNKQRKKNRETGSQKR